MKKGTQRKKRTRVRARKINVDPYIMTHSKVQLSLSIISPPPPNHSKKEQQQRQEAHWQVVPRGRKALLPAVIKPQHYSRWTANYTIKFPPCSKRQYPLQSKPKRRASKHLRNDIPFQKSSKGAKSHWRPPKDLVPFGTVCNCSRNRTLGFFVVKRRNNMSAVQRQDRQDTCWSIVAAYSGERGYKQESTSNLCEIVTFLPVPV